MCLGLCCMPLLCRMCTSPDVRTRERLCECFPPPGVLSLSLGPRPCGTGEGWSARGCEQQGQRGLHQCYHSTHFRVPATTRPTQGHNRQRLSAHKTGQSESVKVLI